MDSDCLFKIKNTEIFHLLYAIKQVKTIVGKLRSGGKEGTRKRREREREIVCCCGRILALVINLTIGQINSSELKDG